MSALEPIKEFLSRGDDKEEPSASRVNQLALLSFVLAIFALALLPSAVATDNYDWITAGVSVVSIALGHVALARTQAQRDNRLALRGLIVSWGLLGVSLTWALIDLKTRGRI